MTGKTSQIPLEEHHHGLNVQILQLMGARTMASVLKHVHHRLPKCHHAHYETHQQRMGALQ